MMWPVSGTRIFLPRLTSLLPCPGLRRWKLCLQLANSIWVLTSPTAFLGLASCFSKGQGMWMGRSWKLFGHPSTKFPPQLGPWLWPHCQELYDDHMRDSNWKKLVGLGESTVNGLGIFEITLNCSEVFVEKTQGCIGEYTNNPRSIWRIQCISGSLSIEGLDGSSRERR